MTLWNFFGFFHFFSYIDRSLLRIHMSAGTYRNAEALPDGAVVVVESSQSGCQIAEELLTAGRHVYVCASRVGRVPRVYRGRDILAWLRDMGFLEVRVDELEDPSMQFSAQPQE